MGCPSTGPVGTSEVLLALARVGMLTFVVASMLALGLRLGLAAVLGPLRDVRLVVGAVLANFLVVPAAAVLAARALPMEPAAGTALVLLGCCAGAPFLPALAGLAHDDTALAVGTMVLLMVLTVLYAPIVVPLAVEGASVSAPEIATSLVALMLGPLVVAMLVASRFPGPAEAWAGVVGHASSTGLALAFVAAMLAGWRELLSSAGSWIFAGTVLLVVVALAAGWLGGAGRSAGDREVLALGAAQRNVAAALVIAPTIGGEVVVRTLAGAVVLPVLLMLLAAELGRRRAA